MVSLEKLVDELNTYFGIYQIGKDPAFSMFIPSSYESINFNWKTFFETDFTEYFNGLMIKGYPEVNQIYCTSFLTDEILRRFIDDSKEGDFLFVHHPISMECGDPMGEWGKGFVPLNINLLEEVRTKKLSIYSCHAPLDIHKELSTSLAIAKSLNTQVIDSFYPYATGYAGLICSIDVISTESLIQRLEKIFEIPYVDFEGIKHDNITKIALVAGCGDVVSCIKEAESKGVQAYIAGEIHCHIDNEYGNMNYNQVIEYVKGSKLSLIGVSHAASEFIVMELLMKPWFEDRFNTTVTLLKESKWWR